MIDLNIKYLGKFSFQGFDFVSCQRYEIKDGCLICYDVWNPRKDIPIKYFPLFMVENFSVIERPCGDETK